MDRCVENALDVESKEVVTAEARWRRRGAQRWHRLRWQPGRSARDGVRDDDHVREMDTSMVTLIHPRLIR